MRTFLLLFILLTFIPLMVQASTVNTKVTYTYDALSEDLRDLSIKYPDLITYLSLSTTSYGRKIWAIKLGHGETSILIHGAHHAREWMTSTLLMKMLETYANAYEHNQSIRGIKPAILDEVSIWFVPMVNPDGVTLQQYGAYAFPTYIHAGLLEMNKGSYDFTRWKANLQGIDLNRQYPANWNKLKGISKKPSYQFYKGTKPLEAEEVKALVKFTRQIKPEIAVAYHSSGNVLFWGFNQWGLTHTANFSEDYYVIGEKIAEMTKYKLEEPKSHQQGGGFTDWFVEEFEKPALTIEIGALVEETSLPLIAFPSIWDRNKAVGLFLATKAIERKR